MIKVDWQKVGGLLPVIVQDEDSSEVLMLAYMNEEALNLSIQTGFAHYFSRTKNRIWKKGEESSNTQKISKMLLDCDNDTLLIKVKQIDAACHTGARSCFFNQIDMQNLSVCSAQIAQKPRYNILDELYHVILDRKLNADPQNSYVAGLFKKGENAILKKVGEEASEFIMACKEESFVNEIINLNQKDRDEKLTNLKIDREKNSVVYEAADVCFHIMVALVLHSIHPDQIKAELARRFGISGIEEKKSRYE
ncbi:MAG: bifunctional phosphoribosyl-AMP cyclohydrolase/phosphoribosyl-ATP diphosphatase HisIE [Campylobacter sp.]